MSPALVTGASSGIGEATVHALAAEGTDIALLARRQDRLETIAAELRSAYGVDTCVVSADVRDRDAVDRAVETAIETLGPLETVVANAGVGRGDAVVDLTDEQYRTMQATNVDGTFYLARAVLPTLTETNGDLIFIGSFAGKFPRSFNPVYAATKWWVRGFAHSLSAQVGDDGVGITVINPSEVRTEFGSEDGEPFDERFAPGEVSEPEEVADAVAFAASQESSAVQELDLFRRDKYADSGF